MRLKGFYVEGVSREKEEGSTFLDHHDKYESKYLVRYLFCSFSRDLESNGTLA